MMICKTILHYKIIEKLGDTVVQPAQNPCYKELKLPFIVTLLTLILSFSIIHAQSNTNNHSVYLISNLIDVRNHEEFSTNIQNYSLILNKCKKN